MIKWLRFSSKATLLLIGAFFSLSAGFSQDFQLNKQPAGAHSSRIHSVSEKCGHTLLEAYLEKEMGYFGSKPFFESWIDQKIVELAEQPQVLSRTSNEPRLIPVVVHVIHSGQPEGSGSNIPDSQILAQIEILNEDFRRLNADADRTPAEFLPVAGDANIEFVLAKQNPAGLPTSGIVRVQGSQNNYAPEDATLIGQTSQWDPEEYLNIWVVPLEQPFIGYASFPISDLPGLNFSPASALTDGVTIDYRFFGSGGSAVSASLGRTATHEVGHYFGLRHIWGDGGCGVDDFVDDTPLQDNSNTVCNSNPSRFSCDSNDMIQNYMDYTPDACMNIFTLGQIERFNAVLENSPRRTTLVNNRATEEPVLAEVDLGILRIIEPGDFACNPVINPEIEVINAGENTLTSGRIELWINGVLQENKRFTFNLTTGESTTLSFEQFTLVPDVNEVEFRIVQANDQADQNEANNIVSSDPVLQIAVDLPFETDLAEFPDPWTILNPDGLFTWEKVNVPISGESQDLVYIRHYEYESPGQLDYLISPIIDLAEYPNAQLVFEMAHGPYDQNGFQDNLTVAISEDCGNTFDIVNAPYQKSGQELETSPALLTEFVPTSEDQFRTEVVNLSDYSDLGAVRIAIITENSFGNNIYLKNIRILPNEEFRYELTLNELVTPAPISDGTHENETVSVTNTGNLPVTRFLFSKSTNDSQAQTFIASGSTVEPGETFLLNTNNSSTEGKNHFEFRVFRPNFDQNGDNGSFLSRYTIESRDTVRVPWRQSFNASASLNPWETINPENDLESWQVIPLANGSEPDNVAVLENTTSGNNYWLGTPIFDLSVSRQASIFFDLAAGEVSESTTLSVRASEDGGENYTEVWALSGAELATVSAGAANPNSPGDYERQFIDLSEFAGSGKEQARLAFVVSGSSGSDDPIYLDNLELFLSANPEPVIPGEGMTTVYPNPATDIFNIAFYLENFEEVNIQIISSTGAVVHDVNYPNTLNQTYPFSTQLFSRGLYIIKVTSPSISETKRLIIN